MAFAYPAAALAGLWALGGYAHNAKRTAVQKSREQAPEEPFPFNAPIAHMKDYGIFTDDRFFVSVQEDRDVQGARIFWVDYGNGQRVQQYFDPRIII